MSSYYRVVWLLAAFEILSQSAWAAESGETAAPRESKDFGTAMVLDERTFVYEHPDVLSNTLRALYPGEIVTVLGNVRTPQGKTWTKIRLGFETAGFVDGTKVRSVKDLPIEDWTPPRVLRDEKPVAIGLRVMGETFGGALNFRFQPFSRLGFGMSAGSVTEDNKMVGTVISGSLLLVPVLRDFSPIVELGFSRASYHKKLTTLRMTNFFMTASGEWIFNSGVFVGLGIVYVRCVDLEVAVEYEDSRDRTFKAEHYGSLDPGEDNAFQALKPLMTLGYAF
jgi:hypothetical protein